MEYSQPILLQTIGVLRSYQETLRAETIITILEKMEDDVRVLEEAEYERFVQMVNKQPNVICAMWRGSRIKRIPRAFAGRKMLKISQADIDEARDI